MYGLVETRKSARPENRTSFNAVAEAFLAKHLGGRIEPMSEFVGSSITIPAGAKDILGLPAGVKTGAEQDPT